MSFLFLAEGTVKLTYDSTPDDSRRLHQVSGHDFRRFLFP